MSRPIRLAVVACAALIFAWPAGAALPVALLGKQILKQMIIDTVKGQLMGSLANMGCKGAALAGAISTLDVARARPMDAVRGALPGMVGGTPGMGMTMDPAQLSALMAQMQTMPGMPAMTPEQAQQMQQGLAMVQSAMANPLSRAETLAVFDELAALGLMSEAMKSEARDCLTLAPPGSERGVGMAGAMIKQTVLPALRDAKAQMAALSPDEQDQLVAVMTEELRNAAPEDRKSFFEGIGAGFFPPGVVERVKVGVER